MRPPDLESRPPIRPAQDSNDDRREDRREDRRTDPAENAGDAAPAPASDAAPLPDLPNITLVPTPLSRGPLAAVYKGWDRAGQRDVIVKAQRTAGDPIAAERFRREAVVMGRLCHPNIVALYEFGEGDPAALVMEYVPGQNLAALVGSDGWLSPDRAASVIEDIAAALDCAHAQGIIHRDVKPSNILLSKRGPALLTDFGVAHIDDDTPLTVMGDILGTIEYASPEQVHGNETPDARSDVYSLAAVAYFALCGTPPFRAADNSTQAQLSVMHRQVFAEPPPLRFHREDIAPEVERAVLRGLAKAPGARYPSAGQFAATLRAATLRTAPAPAASRTVFSTVGRSGALAGALAAAVLLFLGALAFWKTGHVGPAASRPEQVAQNLPVKSSEVIPAKVVPAKVIPAAVPAKTASAKPAPVKTAVVRPAPVKAAPVRPVAAAPRRRASPVRVAVVPTAPPKPVRRTASVRPVPAVRPAPTVRPPSAPPRIARASAPPVRTAPAPPAPRPAVAAVKRPTAWLYVYANQNVAPPGTATRMMSIVPLSVWVDGYQASDLAAGRWTSLPAGQHRVSFVPDPRSGFAPRKDLFVTLAPGARVSRQILLPRSADSRVATAPAPAAPVPPRTASGPASAFIAWPGPPIGWYTVSGWAAVKTPGRTPTLARASAEWVKVDGTPVLPLALGQWARLPAGKHTVTFQPTAGIGVGPKTWAIDLAPQAYLDQKIPLPPLSAP